MAIPYNSNYDLTVPFSDVCAQIHLQASTEETYTVPGNSTQKYSVRFGYASDSNVFVRMNATAGIPGAGLVTQEQYNEFKPGFDGSQRYVNGGDVIHFITPDTTAYVGISLRSLP